MQTMNIAMPDNLKDYVQQRVALGGYGSTSEYIRDLIRSDQRLSAQTTLEAELLKGLASGPARKVTAADFERLRQEVKRGSGKPASRRTKE